MTTEKRRAVFFDRDGVIFHPVTKSDSMRNAMEIGRTRAPFSFEEFQRVGGVVASAKEVIQSVKKRGFLAILVTNQPDIGYGHLTRDEWEHIHAHARALPFDDEFICFHGRDDGCECKKPKPGMLLAAAKKWNIDLSQSYFVGDTASDTLAAKAAGCRSIVIDMTYNREIESDFRAKSLNDVCEVV